MVAEGRQRGSELPVLVRHGLSVRWSLSSELFSAASFRHAHSLCERASADALICRSSKTMIQGHRDSIGVCRSILSSLICTTVAVP